MINTLQLSEDKIQGYINKINQLRKDLPEQVKKAGLKCKIEPDDESWFIEHRNYKITPANSAAAWSLLTEYYSKIGLLIEKLLFLERWKTWNLPAMEMELRNIETFIETAHASKDLYIADFSRIKVPFPKISSFGPTRPRDEKIFLRLASPSLFKRLVKKESLMFNDTSEETQVYSRYFLFRIFLKNQINKYMEGDSAEEIKNESGLSISDIALTHHYKVRVSMAEPLEHSNKEKIASEYGIKSADKLYQKYLFFSNKDNRFASETRRLNAIKYKRFEKVIKYLAPSSPAGRLAKREFDDFEKDISS